MNVNSKPDISGVPFGYSKNDGYGDSSGFGLVQDDSLSTTNTLINARSNSSITSASAAAEPEIEIENLDGVPSAEQLVFSRIGSLNNPPPNGVHNLLTLWATNIGKSPLRISGVPITGP
jgi:hypothetical protein